MAMYLWPGWYQAGRLMISMGGSSYLTEQPLGVSLSLIKSQPIISISVSCGFNQWQCVCGLGWQSNWQTTDIYGRVFFPNGTALGSEFRINQITTRYQQTRQLRV